MQMYLVFVSCLSLVFGAAVDVQNNEAENDGRSIVLPGPNCANQWQITGNPCANNPRNKLNFPHPSENTMFLQCGAYNRLFIVQCPSGEVYDQATTTCIKPSQIVQQPIQNIGSVGLTNPCTTQRLSAGKYFFNVVSDNRKFIECDQVGNAQILTCPSQLIWDQSRQSCVFSLQAGTVLSPGTLGTGVGTLTGLGLLSTSNPCSAQAISQQALFFSHPDATKFIQCDLQGNAFVQQCPSGLVWNQYLETCASQLATLTGQLGTNGYFVGSGLVVSR